MRSDQGGAWPCHTPWPWSAVSEVSDTSDISGTRGSCLRRAHARRAFIVDQHLMEPAVWREERLEADHTVAVPIRRSSRGQEGPKRNERRIWHQGSARRRTWTRRTGVVDLESRNEAIGLNGPLLANVPIPVDVLRIIDGRFSQCESCRAGVRCLSARPRRQQETHDGKQHGRQQTITYLLHCPILPPQLHKVCRRGTSASR